MDPDSAVDGMLGRRFVVQEKGRPNLRPLEELRPEPLPDPFTQRFQMQTGQRRIQPDWDCVTGLRIAERIDI